MEKGNKRTTTKKANTKRVNAAIKSSTTISSKKSTTAKKSVAKVNTVKATPKKITKKAPVKKVAAVSVQTKNVAKKVTPNVKPRKINPSAIPKKDVIDINKEKELNRELLMRSILLVSYTLIIILLVMGFVESLTKDAKVVPKTEIVSYITNNNLISENNIIDLEDANFKLSALDGDYFVYITYTDVQVNAFEKDLITLLDKKNLKDKFYYINVDKIKNEDNVIALVNKYLGFQDALVNKIPTIVYVDSENIVRNENIITRIDNNLISINDFEGLLDRNGF